MNKTDVIVQKYFELLIQRCTAKDKQDLLACHSHTLGLWHSSLAETLNSISDTTLKEKEALHTWIIYQRNLKNTGKPNALLLNSLVFMFGMDWIVFKISLPGEITVM